MGKEELRNRIRALAVEAGKGLTVEEQIAAAVLRTLVGAIGEGGEPMMALGDMCFEFAKNGGERMTRKIAALEIDC
mgnify:CR=1 FL=1